MNGGIPFQTSLRKDSSQAASKILPVYRIQLSSTKSQTCTSVTVERQKAIHTPTMAPAAKDGHREMEGRVNGVVDLRHRKRVTTPEEAAGMKGLQQRSSALCREKDQEFCVAKSYIPTISICSGYMSCNFQRRTAKSSHYYPHKSSQTIQLQ